MKREKEEGGWRQEVMMSISDTHRINGQKSTGRSRETDRLRHRGRRTIGSGFAAQ